METVTVEIGDRSYTLKAGDNPDYIQKVAAYVDQKMKELARLAPSLQPTHLAVLTAINITDEYMRTQGPNRDEIKQAGERIQALIDMIPS